MQQADRWNALGGSNQGEYQEKKMEAAKDTEVSKDSGGKIIGAPSEPSEAREQAVKFLVSHVKNQNTTWDHKDASKGHEFYFI